MSVAENVLALPAHVSHSQVSTWSRCGRQYLLERVMRLETQPQGALIGGSAVHEAIEAAMREGLSSHDAQLRFIDLFAAAVADAGGAAAVRWAGRKSKAQPNGEDESFWLVHGVKYVERAMNLLDAFQQTGHELVSFEADYAFEVDGKRVVAKPDAVFAHPEGVVTVLDWKTGSMASPQNGIQVGGFYTIAVCEAHGYKPEQVVGQVAMLRKDGPDGLLTYNPLLYIDLARQMIRDFIAGTEAGVFSMSPGVFCGGCGVRSACEFGKTLNNEGGEE